MKKLALTSLLAVVAATGAHAANVIDGNPLYMPKAGHFYSETSLGSHSEATEDWTLGETFGYGVTDKLVVFGETSLSEAESFDGMSWNEFVIGGAFRALDKGAWKVDAYGTYGVMPVWGDHRPFLDEDDTGYAWTLGVRGGYTTAQWTVAGHLAFNYGNEESFNWGDEGRHLWTLGVDGQYVIDSNWNLVAGLEYTGTTDDDFENAGIWDATFGVSYNIDATKYVGAYVSGRMDHHGGDAADEWEWQDGFGFGVKFGIDF